MKRRAAVFQRLESRRVLSFGSDLETHNLDPIELCVVPAELSAAEGEGVSQGALPPHAPTNLVAVPVSSSEVTLTWDLAGDSDTQLVIERRNALTPEFQVLTTLPGGENTFTDRSGWAETTYVYRIRAANAAGMSDYSNEQEATTVPIPSESLAPIVDLQVVALAPDTAWISFTDPNTSDGKRGYLLERSADGVSYMIVKSLLQETSWTDAGLAPGETYFYRIRGYSWNNATSDYSLPVSITMPARPEGAPLAPSSLETDDVTATSVTLRWTSHDPTDPSFRVERQVFNPYHPQPWIEVGMTEAGATGFVDTTVYPESAYVYRVRAVNDQGESGFAVPADDVMESLFDVGIGVITSSPGTGTPKVYDIGPGQAYENISDLEWSTLGPGDTVNLHYKPGGYRELFLISSRGTAAEWITISGVPDPNTGALPVIDGLEAVLAPQFQSSYAPLSGAGGILVGPRPGFVTGYQPGYLRIENLRIQRFYQGNTPNTFTDFDGSTKAYGPVGAGIYLYRADHITISNSEITGNGQGIFGAGSSSFLRLMTDITVESNHIHGNGNLGSNRQHNTYLEAIDTIYQDNRYGPMRDGAGGNGLKDRSVGVIVRGNYLEGGAHELQFPTAENQVHLAVTIPRYHQALVYGNTIVDGPENVSGPIEYGGEGKRELDRKGILSLFHNTVVVRADKSDVYRVSAVYLTDTSQTLDARNNIFTALPETSDAIGPNFGLLGANNYQDREAYAYFGRNWVPKDYQLERYGTAGFKGHAAGLDNLLVGDSADPGFLDVEDVATSDYRLAVESVVIDEAMRLSGTTAGFPVDRQYLPSSGAVERVVKGAAADLGGVEYGTYPPLDSPGDQESFEGDEVALQVNSIGADGFQATGLPPGLAISSTGLISGTVQTGAAGTYQVLLTATDSGASSELMFYWIVQADQFPVLIDDGETGYSEEGPGWFTSSWWKSGYQGDQRLSRPGSGESTATWEHAVAPGSYTVQTSWSAYSKNVTDAPYRVFDGETLLAEVRVNQQLSPTRLPDESVGFFSLGEFAIESGNLKVVLGNDAGGGIYVVADVVRVFRGEIDKPAEIVEGPGVVDDGEAGYAESPFGWFTISWWNSGYQSDSRATHAGTGENTATWQQSVSPGSYTVQVSWDGYSKNVSDAPYRIYDGETLLAEVRVDQRQTPTRSPEDPAAFFTLGTFTFSSDTIRVVLGNDASGGIYVIADAMRVIAGQPAEPPAVTDGPTTVDDGQAGYSESPYGWFSISWWNAGYDADSRFARAGNGDSTATWQQQVEPGTYTVQASWSGYHNNVVDAPYRIYDDDLYLTEVRVNQEQTAQGTLVGGTPFQALATVVVSSGLLRVELSNDASGGIYLVADAIRVVAETTAASPAANSLLSGTSQSIQTDTSTLDIIYSSDAEQSVRIRETQPISGYAAWQAKTWPVAPPQNRDLRSRDLYSSERDLELFVIDRIFGEWTDALFRAR